MPDYISSAFVRVKPDTKGFRADLREQVKQRIRGVTFTIPIKASVQPFRAQLQSELRKSAIKVKVTPDMKGFREELKTRLASSTKGIKVGIPVETRGLTVKDTAAADAAAAGAADKAGRARKRQQDATKGLSAVEKERRRILKDLQVAEASMAAASAKGITVAERDLALSHARRVTDRAYADVQKLVAANAAQVNLAVRSKVTAVASDLSTTRKSIVNDEALVAAKARVVEALGTEVTALKLKNDFLLAEQRLNKVAQATEQALAVARTANATATIRELEALQASVALQRASLGGSIKAFKEREKAERRLGGAIDERRRREAFAARGAAATGLSLLGVRGATLAANSAFLAGAAAVATFAKSVGAAANLEQNLNVFAVTAKATSDELRQAAEVARQLGADISLPAVGAGDAAEAFSELAKAGLSVRDSLEGARGVLQLATAAQIANADATLLVASAINAFGLAGREASRVADLLTGAANESQGSVADIGTALQQSAGAAKQAGVSLEDTVAILALLARNGLRGSDAGTSLRTALLRLINPTDKAAAELDRLNIHLRDAQGNIRAEAFAELGVALGDLPRNVRNATLAIIFGNDAFRAAGFLAEEGARGLNQMRDATQEVGLASQLANARTRGFAGQVEGLKNTLATIGVEFGTNLLPALGGFVQGMNEATVAISSSEQVRRTLRDSVEATSEAFDAFSAIVSTLGPPLLSVAGALSEVIGVIGVTEVLAAVIAYRKFHVVAGATLLATQALTRGFVAARTALAGLLALNAASAVAGTRAAFTSLAATLGTFVRTTQGAALVLGVLAAGMVFLATRESQLEGANKRLESSLENVRTAMLAAKQASEDYANAISSIRTDELSLEEAKLAVGRARSTLANSAAGKETRRRKELELQLQFALENVRAAEDRLRDTRRDAAALVAEQAQASRNLADARREEARAIAGVIDATRAESGVLSREQILAARKGELDVLKLQEKAIDDVVAALRKRADQERKNNTEESRATARRIDILADLTRDLGKLPDQRTINVVLNSQNLRRDLTFIVKSLGTAGEEGAEAFVDGMLAGFGGRIGAVFIQQQQEILKEKILFYDAGRQLGDAVVDGVEDAVKNRPLTAKQILGQLKGLDEQALDIEIAGGSRQDQLRNLRRREQKLRNLLSQEGISTETRRQAKQELASVLNEIESIEKEIADEARDRADKIREQRDKTRQAIIDAFGLRIARQENRIMQAQASEGLRNDLRETRVLKKILIEIINSGKLRKDELAAFNRQLIQVRQDERNLLKQIADQRRQDAEERRDLIRRSLELDIEFFQTTENERGEIRARERLIASFQRELDALKKLKKLTDEQRLRKKELRNAIAKERAEIKELRDETKERNDEFGRLVFETLQRQQGFAANLLGNLIPLSATPGLVGNVSSAPLPQLGGTAQVGAGAGALAGGAAGLGQSLAREAAVKGAAGGPTRGQATVEIDLLREILEELRLIRGGRAHPEARQSKASGAAVMDVM